MKISTLLLLSLTFVGLFGLHHQQSSLRDYDENAELSQLNSQQQQFESQLSSMQSDLEKVTAKLTSTTNDEEKVGILEDAVARHRELVFQSSKTLIPAFNVSKCACEDLSPE